MIRFLFVLICLTPSVMLQGEDFIISNAKLEVEEVQEKRSSPAICIDLEEDGLFIPTTVGVLTARGSLVLGGGLKSKVNEEGQIALGAPARAESSPANLGHKPAVEVKEEAQSRPELVPLKVGAAVETLQRHQTDTVFPEFPQETQPKFLKMGNVW